MADCKCWWNLSDGPRIHSEKCYMFKVPGPRDSGFIGPIRIASVEEQVEFLSKIQVMIILEKIVSGGQRGADEGALQAGRLLSITTGGFAPPNFMTEDGPNPSLGLDYGLIAVDKDPKIYPIRTRLNVEHSDGTLWMGLTNSRGHYVPLLPLIFIRNLGQRILL